MKKILLVLVLMSNLVFSQDKITKNLGDFDKLKIYRGLTVTLIKSDNQKIVIEGAKSEKVTIKNKDGILRISLSVLETFSSDQVRIQLYFNSEINVIDVNEGAIISSEDVFKQKKLTLKAQEAGEIKLKVATYNLDVKIVSGGIVVVSGVSENQNVKVNSGGIYKAENLQTDYANITASTGGVATITASKLADANANLGAVITIKGEPEELREKESLGGYIRQ